jgi:hypothetical protein
MSGQDQPCSYQNSPRTSQNHTSLLGNDKSKHSASEIALPYPLLTILDENSEERENKDISKNGTDLLLAFGKQEKPATVLTSLYSHPHVAEILQPHVAEISHLHNNPGYEQSVITHNGPEELRDSSPSQKHYDEDQSEQQQREEVLREVVEEDDNNYHMMDRGKRKRDETDESYPFEHNIPDTNSIDNNPPQPAKRRKPQLSSLDNASVLAPKDNPKDRLRQRHSRSLSLPTQHKMKHRQSRNNCSHTSNPFRKSCDMIESVSIAEYHEWPLQGLIKCAIIENKTTCEITLQLNHVPERLHASILSKTLGIHTDNAKTDASNTVNVTGEDEWEVDTIRAVRKRYNKLEYRADWLGVDEDPQYYPASDFKYSPHKIRDFHLAHPNLPGPPENLLKWIRKWEDGVDNYDELTGSKEMSQYSRVRFFGGRV